MVIIPSMANRPVISSPNIMMTMPEWRRKMPERRQVILNRTRAPPGG